MEQHRVVALGAEDIREALRIIRERERARAVLHALEHELIMFEQQMAAVYGLAPGEWRLRDFTVGFERTEGDHA